LPHSSSYGVERGYIHLDLSKGNHFGGIKMKQRLKATSITILILILLMGLFASACNGSGNEGEIVGENLLDDRCTECHTLSRVKSAQKTREQWERTIDRMMALGAELNPDERSMLLDYLETTYSD
jgi:hypothetical protein